MMYQCIQSPAGKKKSAGHFGRIWTPYLHILEPISETTEGDDRPLQILLIPDYTAATGWMAPDWHPQDKDIDKIGRPPTLGLDSPVGRAPAREGHWFKFRSSKFVFVQPQISKKKNVPSQFPLWFTSVIGCASLAWFKH